MPSPSSPGPQRNVAAAAFFAGLVLFAVPMLVLGGMAATARTIPFEPGEVALVNGTAYQAYHLSDWNIGYGRVEGSYAFPSGAGSVLLVRCDQMGAIAEGRAPDPAGVHALRSASTGGDLGFRLDDVAWRLYGVNVHQPGVATPPPPNLQVFLCGPAVLALAWNATDLGQAQATSPEASFALRETPLDLGAAPFLLVLAALGVALVATGGVAWTRARRAPVVESAEVEESTAETLLRATQATLSWLERMRRYLLLGGILGIFLWYPVLLAWAFQTGRRGSEHGGMALVLAAAVLAFLGALTALWTREYLNLHRELRGWRERLERLRRREQDLLDSLDAAA